MNHNKIIRLFATCIDSLSCKMQKKSRLFGRSWMVESDTVVANAQTLRCVVGLVRAIEAIQYAAYAGHKGETL